jgi:hypothetical protein
MAVIESTDIKVYLSGGSANTDPNASLGGVISTTEMTDDNLYNLFAKVDAAEASAGSTKYRGVYIKNENGHTLTLQAAIAYIKSQTTSGDTSIEVAVANEAADVEMATIANEDTAPASISGSWVSAVGEASGSDMGNLDDGSYRGIWIKRIVTASATAYGNDTTEFGVRGETTAI